MGRKTGHRARFNGDFGTGGAENGTPGEVQRGFQDGGAEIGTPGEVQRGFRDRWGEKWDTGRGWRGISGQVGPKTGHLSHTRPVEQELGHWERLEGDFGTGGAENGTPGEVRRTVRRVLWGAVGGRRFGGDTAEG